MPLEAGSSLGPFQIVSLVGRGGMAAVYKAYEPELDRHVALKVLPAAFLHDREFGQRFEREAKVIAKLEHPHIVPIHRFGIDGGTPWMSMRLLRSETLADLLEKRRVDGRRMISILSQVAEALDYAHRRKVVHRDIKPGNILFDEQECAYVGDFGIARLTEASVVLTQTGTIAGTPQYMSPEQALGKRVDHRSDLYSLGVIAYEVMTGRLPFAADNMMALLMQHAQEPVPVPEPDEAPPSVVQPIIRCLEKDPARRWPTAAAFVDALADGVASSATAETALVGESSPQGERLPATEAITTLRGGVPTAAAEEPAAFVDDTAPDIAFEAVSRSTGGMGLTGVARAGVGLAVVAVAGLGVLFVATREAAVPEDDAGVPVVDAATESAAPSAPTTDSTTNAPQPDPAGSLTTPPVEPAPRPASAASSTSNAPASPARVSDPAPPAQARTEAPGAGIERAAARARSSFTEGDFGATLEAIEDGLQRRGDDGALRQLLGEVEAELRRRATDALDESIGSINASGEGPFNAGYAQFEEGHALREGNRLLGAARAFLAAEELFGEAVRSSALAGETAGGDASNDAGTGTPNDRQGVEDAVRRYALAYERESTAALKAVFPSLTPEELDSIDRSFLDWESVSMDLGIEQISVDGPRAEVWMRQRQTIVPNEGQVRRTESGLVLLLAKAGPGDRDGWHITEVRQTR